MSPNALSQHQNYFHTIDVIKPHPAHNVQWFGFNLGEKILRCEIVDEIKEEITLICIVWKVLGFQMQGLRSLIRFLVDIYGESFVVA